MHRWDSLDDEYGNPWIDERSGCSVSVGLEMECVVVRRGEIRVCINATENTNHMMRVVLHMMRVVLKHRDVTGQEQCSGLTLERWCYWCSGKMVIRWCLCASTRGCNRMHVISGSYARGFGL